MGGSLEVTSSFRRVVPPEPPSDEEYITGTPFGDPLSSPAHDESLSDDVGRAHLTVDLINRFLSLATDIQSQYWHLE